METVVWASMAPVKHKYDGFQMLILGARFNF